MNSEQADELCVIQDAVCDDLRKGKYIDRYHSRKVCQYLVLPSFENPVSWDVNRVLPRKAAQARLYRSCWRKDVDERVICSPIERLKYPRPFKPTIEVDWTIIDLEQVELLITRLRSIRLPLAIARPHGGLDGVSFELSVGDYFCNARIGWWYDIPEEWHELRPVISDLLQLFEQAWTARIEPNNNRTE